MNYCATYANGANKVVGSDTITADDLVVAAATAAGMCPVGCRVDAVIEISPEWTTDENVEWDRFLTAHARFCKGTPELVEAAIAAIPRETIQAARKLVEAS